MKMRMDMTEALLPTQYYGVLRILCFKTPDGKEHAALVKGTVKGKHAVLTRIHSECLTGDVFHSLRCDCGQQLENALKAIKRAPQGILLYLRQEGRGIGLLNKIKAYHLQEQGMDTVEANVHLGLEPDAREYSEAACMLQQLGVKSILLLTNNPSKVEGLRDAGIQVIERKPSKVRVHRLAKKYLKTKKDKMGHLIS